MRRRITFIHGADDAFAPEQLQLENSTLYIKSLTASREDRIIFNLGELPNEVFQVLRQCHELHLRWVGPLQYPTRAPFVSRASPGLSLFFTPQKGRSTDLLCPLLLKIFGTHLKCSSPEDTFTSVPLLSGRFASSAAYEYHQLLPSLEDIVEYFRVKICAPLDQKCHVEANYLGLATYLDIDYDAISHSFVLSVFHHGSPNSGPWDEMIRTTGKGSVEVGVLVNENPLEPEELSLGGFLTVVGEDITPKPTLFSFPSRHHVSPPESVSTYRMSFTSPTGLHPTMRLTFPYQSEKPPSSTCALHAYVTLPSHIFPDKYQFSDPLFLASKNLKAVRSISGETDLEAPDWVISKWGSRMLVELAPPFPSPGSHLSPMAWHADIPVHLRYLPPTAGGVEKLQVPWPVVFWACTAEEGSKMNVNPFDRVNLGYDGLFGPRTMFYHLEPDLAGDGQTNGDLVERIQVPVLDTNGMPWIEPGTVVVVLLGVAWVFWKLLDVLRPAEDADGTARKKNQ